LKKKLAFTENNLIIVGMVKVLWVVGAQNASAYSKSKWRKTNFLLN
jgi:hypothetical protein